VPDDPRWERRPDRSGRSALVALGVAVLCCAGPSLLAAFGLGAGATALGEVLGRPAVVLVAALLLAAVAAVALRIARGGRL
jgi:hypothetical protein